MSKRIRSSLVLLLFVTVVFPTAVFSQASPGPNIVLIMADDMGWGDIAMNGNPAGISTPNLEKIARSGARFEHFMVSPLCAPTRASLLTGRYHLRTGVADVTGGLETMRTEEVTMAEVFKKAGYATGMFGKWHNGAHYPQDPNGQGFDEFFGFCGGHWTNYFNTRLQHNHSMVETHGYITDVLTDAALDFIEKNKAHPFLCYIPYNAPHGPFQVDDKYFNKFKSKGVNDMDAAIYGMVENVDENIGRVLQKLDALKLTGNTIVVFLTDNGPNSTRYNGNMKGKKAAVDEGGVRVPLFIRWPAKIKRETVVKQLAAHIDLLPTLVELSGITPTRTLPWDGKSLVPLLQGKTVAWADRKIYTHILRDTDTDGVIKPFPGAIRTGQYRYIRGNERDQLYDMLVDPAQRTDIASQQSTTTEAFRKSYDEWFAAVTEKKIHSEITEVGYAQAPATELFAPDAVRKGALKYFVKNGYAHDWFTGWQQPADTAIWKIEVVESGNYKVNLKYNCTDGFLGSTMQIKIGDKMTSKTVQVPFTGKFYPSPDRVTRIEAYEKDWSTLEVGTVTLSKGMHQLKVFRSAGDPTTPFELKSVLVEKL